jgi:hypothetical protein
MIPTSTNAPTNLLRSCWHSDLWGIAATAFVNSGSWTIIHKVSKLESQRQYVYKQIRADGRHSLTQRPRSGWPMLSVFESVGPLTLLL